LLSFDNDIRRNDASLDTLLTSAKTNLVSAGTTDECRELTATR
jgi:hypothetical protein